VSVTTATLLAGSFALLGVVVERLLRLVRRLRCEPSGWETRFTCGLNQRGEFSEVEPKQAEMFAKRVQYRFASDLFNGKEVPTGLREIKVVLVREAGEPLASRPYDLLSVERDPSFDVMTRSDVDVINLPPRQCVRKELPGSFDSREAAVALAKGKWQRVEFVAKRPKRPLLWRKTFRTVDHQALETRSGEERERRLREQPRNENPAAAIRLRQDGVFTTQVSAYPSTTTRLDPSGPRPRPLDGL